MRQQLHSPGRFDITPVPLAGGRFDTAPVPYYKPHQEQSPLVGEPFLDTLTPEGSPIGGALDRRLAQDERLQAARAAWPALQESREEQQRLEERQKAEAATHENTERVLAGAALGASILFTGPGTDELPLFAATIESVPVPNPATIAISKRIAAALAEREGKLQATIAKFNQALATLPEGDAAEREILLHGLEMTARLLGAQLKDGSLSDEQLPKTDQAAGQNDPLDLLDENILTRVLAGLRRL